MTQTAQFDQVTVLKNANVYFDGKCMSHTLQFTDGLRKSVGVILPATLVFNTNEPERMEIVSGECYVKLEGSEKAVRYVAGDSFTVSGNASFEITVKEGHINYVCHYGG